MSGTALAEQPTLGLAWITGPAAFDEVVRNIVAERVLGLPKEPGPVGG